MTLESEVKRTETLVKAIRTERQKLTRIVELADKPVPMETTSG